jgi:phosphoglycerate kinase
MAKRTIQGVPVRGRRVIVRVDYNVPLTDAGEVADDRRIVESLPTLKYLREEGARLILLSHLGRPRGPDPSLSLRPVRDRLSEVLGLEVSLSSDVAGPDSRRRAEGLRDGEVLLLENLRFHPGEEANDPAFAGQLADLGELFVEEAFGTVHRAHSSTVGVARLLPTYAGFLVEREVRALSRLLAGFERPFVALLGGAKVADKLPLLEGLGPRTDGLLLGGAIALPFLDAKGHGGGDRRKSSLLDKLARRFLDRSKAWSGRILLPVDVVVEERSSGRTEVRTPEQVGPEETIYDIGPQTRALFLDALREARTVFWNGPLGKAEDPRYSAGTREVLKGLSGVRGWRVSAGGDSARLAQDLGVLDSFDYVSTGGGAALEFVEGRRLPGLEVIPDADGEGDASRDESGSRSSPSDSRT